MSSKTVLLDIETNAINATKIWCVAAKVYNSSAPVVTYGDYDEFVEKPMSQLIELIDSADKIVGHNLSGFDAPTLERLLNISIPWDKWVDTLPLCQLLCPQVAEKSMAVDMPGRLKGSHSLAAWGYRLKIHKDEYTGGFDNISEEMVQYCKQDVLVLEALYDWIIKKDYPVEAFKTELELAPLIGKMTAYGFRFDIAKARDLQVQLMSDRYEISQQLQIAFPVKYIKVEEINPVRNYTNKDPMLSRHAGCPFTKIAIDEFNPNSRQQIVRRLQELYNWKPTEFTENDNPSVDETVLEGLDYPEAQLLAKYFTIQKRIGQLSDGSNGWLRLVESDERIHGKYMQCGALTGRATHFNPNISQVPSPRLLYGQACRELFIAAPGKVLVGVDLAGLELRCLAGYMKPYDKGSMIHSVLYGKKDDKTDVYSVAASSINQPRDVGKTLILAMMYGAGNKKLAWTVDPHLTEDRAQRYGKQIRDNIAASLEGYEDLVEAVRTKIKDVGYIVGLDKRKLQPREDYSGLNTLLQSAGAVLAKRWVILSYHNLVAKGFKWKEDFGFTAWSHDEICIETRLDISKEIGYTVVKSAKEAGEYYKFPCPMDGESKIGKNWYEIH